MVVEVVQCGSGGGAVQFMSVLVLTVEVKHCGGVGGRCLRLSWRLLR